LAAAPAQAVWGFSGSLEVSSAEDVVEAPHSEFLSLESGTIAFTFNADSISGRQGLFTKDASYYGGGGNHFSAYLDNGELVVRFQDGASDKIFSLNGISPNQDYGLHVTFGDGQVSAMLDGVEFGAAAFDMNWQENAEHIQVGALGWGSASGQSGFSHIFDGTISEVAIFSENLTPSQADEAFQGTITPDGITETTEGSSNAAADGTTEEPQSEATGSTIDEGNSTDADTSDSGAPYEGSNPLDQSALDESLIWELASQEISGASDVVELAHFAEMEMSEGTIALSFNADELSGRQGLISKDASYYEGGGNHFAAYLEKDLLTIRFQNGDSDQVFTVEGISANQDYDLHIGFRDGSVSAWLDGELINSADFTMNWEQNIQHLQVGALGWASDSGEAGFRDVFKGTISDVLIIDGMLTPEELASAASGDFLEPIGESETEATQTIGTSTLVASDPLLEWIVHSMSDVSTETTLEEIPSDEYDEETSLMWTE
jgi:hypothetical protein